MGYEYNCRECDWTEELGDDVGVTADALPDTCPECGADMDSSCIDANDEED